VACDSLQEKREIPTVKAEAEAAKQQQREVGGQHDSAASADVTPNTLSADAKTGGRQ
jgi:hypothetical protein